jgi:hypothetical protein
MGIVPVFDSIVIGKGKDHESIADIKERCPRQTFIAEGAWKKGRT